MVFGHVSLAFLCCFEWLVGNLHAKGTIHFEWDSGLSAIVLLGCQSKCVSSLFFSVCNEFLWPGVYFVERIESWLDSPYITLNTLLSWIWGCQMSDFTTNHRFLVPTNIQSMSGSRGSADPRCAHSRGRSASEDLGSRNHAMILPMEKDCHKVARFWNNNLMKLSV